MRTKEQVEAIIAALSGDDSPAIVEVVKVAMEEVSREHTILAEALLRQNAENMIRFQQMFDRQQNTLEKVLDQRLAVVAPQAYATVARSRPRGAVGTTWPPFKSSPGTNPPGPAFSPPPPASGAEVEPFDDDDKPLPEHRRDDDEEEMELIADSTGLEPPPSMSPPRS